MVRPPTDLEREQLIHFLGSSTASTYDPAKAHEYYIRTRKLKGRKPAAARTPTGSRTARAPTLSAKTKQRKELQARIQNLQKKLGQLEELIKKKEHEAASENRKSKAKKERAAKEKDKPKTAAEKAKASRDSEKYRDKHKQELKTKAKDASKPGGGSKEKKATSKTSVSDLRALATKVKGQIAVAKQKLAAL